MAAKTSKVFSSSYTAAKVSATECYCFPSLEQGDDDAGDGASDDGDGDDGDGDAGDGDGDSDYGHDYDDDDGS